MAPARINNGESQPRPRATIQAVAAVPTFAPRSTICAMAGTIRSFSTKEATIKAVAVELCRATVAMKPAQRDLVPLLVLLARPARSFVPKARVMPPLTWARPNRSRATAPKRLMLTIADSISHLLHSAGFAFRHSWRPNASSDPYFIPTHIIVVRCRAAMRDILLNPFERDNDVRSALCRAVQE